MVINFVLIHQVKNYDANVGYGLARKQQKSCEVQNKEGEMLRKPGGIRALYNPDEKFLFY